MIITDIKKVQKLKAARRSPYLPMLTFDIQSFCGELVKVHFPTLHMPITVSFTEELTLACVAHDDDRADILIHVLMNDPSTPCQVFSHILTHELIHLIVPKETINGKETFHTPTFWLHESRLVPERLCSWTWIWHNFGRCLRSDQKAEATYVKRNWKKYANTPRLAWEECKRIQPSAEIESCAL